MNQTDLASRVAYSQPRIEAFREQVKGVRRLDRYKNLAIYATGSYGRREAVQKSDLDLILVCDETADTPKPTALDEIVIKADLIHLCEELGYPPFDGDGAYLKIHTVEELSTKIGNQREDAENHFTARMLLLLESAWLYNEPVYMATVNACLTQYYRDFDKHKETFRPLFLLNDITRYWKTLCLNYEARRTGAKEEDRVYHKLKNLRLKNSRMMTCYSLVACLCDPEVGRSQELVASLTQTTPFDRLRSIANKLGLNPTLRKITEAYEWFLSRTGAEKSNEAVWIESEKAEVKAYEAQLGEGVFELIQGVSAVNPQTLRFLVV